MQFAQGYARRRKRIYAVKRCGFSHFFVTLGYPFCTNFLQKFIMKKVHLFSCFVVLCWFLNDVSLKHGAFLHYGGGKIMIFGFQEASRVCYTLPKQSASYIQYFWKNHFSNIGKKSIFFNFFRLFIRILVMIYEVK